MKKIFSSNKKYSFLKNSILLIFAVAYVLVAIFFHNPNAYAVFNKQINYQGKLTNSSGAAVPDGSYNMEFKLYTVDSGGVAVWTETRIQTNRVMVTNGLFSVLLGEISSMAAVDFNQTLYLGVNIGGTTNTPTPTWDGEMSPRKKLGAVAAAFEAINALTATAGFTVSGGNLVSPILVGGSGTTQDLTLQTTTGVGASGADMHFLVGNNGGTEAMTILNDGKVGIGTSTPQQQLTVSGTSGVTVLTEIFSDDINSGGLLALKARGTPGSPAVPQADDNLLSIGGGGYNGTTMYTYNKAFIGMRASQTWTGSNNGTYITFGTTPNNSTTRVEAMRIDQSGYIGLGDTTPDYLLELYDTTNTPAFALSDDDVAHGLTTLAQTDVFSHLSSLSTTAGGAQWTAVSDTNAQALSVRGIIGSTDPTDTTPAVKIVGAKSNGTTGMADLGTYETVFQVANNDDSAALSIVGGGFVGIGTTAPTYQLTLSKAADQNIIAFDRTSTYSGEDIVGQLSFQYTGDSVANIMVKRDGANDAGKLIFGTQATTAGSMVERMTILSSGYVGIGSTSPSASLTVQNSSSDGSTVARFISTYTSSATSGAGMLGYSDDGAALASGDRLGFFILGGAKDASHILANSVAITGYAAEAWSSSATGGHLAFETTATGATSRTERMRITSAGNVGIGTSVPGAALNLASGKHLLIGGTTAPYSDLYNFAVTSADAGAAFVIDAPSSDVTGRALSVAATGESYGRVLFYSNGQIGFGPGSATRDTFLGRSAANTLSVGSAYDGSGTGHFSASGSITAGTNFLPDANDGAGLGTGTTSFSDLFLASGGVINWNNGNATLTHSAGLLTSNVDLSVPDEAYGVGWDTSTEVPTKNALYDKIEALAAGGGANTALSNLAAVAINTSLISDTNNTDALGSATIGWSDLFLGDGGVINWNNGNTTLTQSSETLAVNSATNAFLRVQTTGLGNTTGDGLEFSLTPTGAYIWNYENVPLYFGNNDIETMTMTTDGNIGVGTDTPAAKLAVAPKTSSVGAEMVTNGTFTGGSTGWNLYADCWSYNNNALDCDGTDGWIDQTIDMTIGSKYRVSFEVSSMTTGSLWVTLGDSTPPGTVTANGTYTYDMVVGSNEDYIGFWVEGFDGTLDNVSVKPLTLNESTPILAAGLSNRGIFIDGNGAMDLRFGTQNEFSISGGANVLSFNKQAGDPSASPSDYTVYRFNGIGAVDATNPFWNGFQWMGHTVTETGSNRYPILTMFSRSATATDPTDYEMMFSLGNLGGLPGGVSFGAPSTTNSFLRFGFGNGTISSEVMRIDQAGLVGIGTNDPSRILSVNKYVAATEVFGSANNPAIYVSNSRGDVLDVKAELQLATVNGGALSAISSIYESYIGANSYSSALVFSTQASGDSTSAPNITERMRISGDGYVGLGTSDPDTLLHLYAVNPIIKLQVPGTGTAGFGLYDVNNSFIGSVTIDNVAGDVHLNPFNASNSLIVKGTSGNVGIGTSSPLVKLDVSGSARVTGTATSVLTGSIDPAASTTVTGVGTAFTTELVVGDRITVSGETRTVTAIASDTSLTVDSAFTDNANDASPDKLPAIFLARDSSNALKLAINDLGQVGIGGVAGMDADNNTNSSLLNLTQTYTDFTGDRYYEPLSMNVVADPVANSAGAIYGMVQYVSNATSSNKNFGKLNGLYIDSFARGSGSTTTVQGIAVYGENISSGTSSSVAGIESYAHAGSSGITTNAYGVYSQVYADGTSTITNGYGLYVDSATKAVGATFTNNFGLYVADQSAVGSTSSFNIYSAGTNSTNYFGGKVGIGTSAPSNLLHLYQNDTGTNGLRFEQASTGDASMVFLLTGVQAWQMGIDNSDSDKFKIGASESSTFASNVLTLQTDGKVGIGTTTPSYLLDIERNGVASSGNPDIKVGYEWPLYLMSQWPNVGFNLYYDSASATTKFGKGSTTDYGGLIQVSPVSGSMQFEVTPTAGNADATATTYVAMLIDKNGNVGVGTTAPEELFEVQGVEATDAIIMLDADDGDNATDSWSLVSDATTNDFQFYNSTTNVAAISSGGNLQIDGTIDVGSFAASTDTSRWVCIDSAGASILQAGVDAASGDCDTSSITIKHAVNDLAVGGIDTLKELRPVSFIYNDDENENIMWGYIAEELDAISPSLAGHNADGAPRSVQKNAVLAVLTKAAQEINLNLEGIAGTITPLEGSANETFVLAFFENLFTKTTAWLADAGNGIVDLFAKKIHTEQLCLKKSDNTEFCVNGDELNALFVDANINTNNSTPVAPSNSNTNNDQDTIAPIITLEGDSVISLAIGDTYQELGAVVTDNLEDSIAVIVSGSVDTNTEGTYLVAYNASDSFGNTAEEVTRQVIVGSGTASNNGSSTETSPSPEPTPEVTPTPEASPTPEPTPEPAPAQSTTGEPTTP